MHRLIAAAALACAGCVTAPAVSPSFKLRPETQPECAALCEQMGMRLGAVVLIHNSAGCVCEPREATARPAEEAAPRARPAGGAATAGGALVFALERAEEERRRDEADRQRRDDEDRRRRDDEDRRRRND
jgi:hypothetical protein